MLSWARNWLAPNAAQLEWLSPEQRRAMWTPRTLMPVSERRRKWNNSHYHAYAFGFRLTDVDGVWTVSHTGSLMGMYSAMTLLPDQKSGFVLRRRPLPRRLRRQRGCGGMAGFCREGGGQRVEAHDWPGSIREPISASITRILRSSASGIAIEARYGTDSPP